MIAVGGYFPALPPTPAPKVALDRPELPTDPYTSIVGQRFGRLLVGEAKRGQGHECTCDCGRVVNVFRSQLMRRGGPRSCGCGPRGFMTHKRGA